MKPGPLKPCLDAGERMEWTSSVRGAGRCKAQARKAGAAASCLSGSTLPPFSLPPSACCSVLKVATNPESMRLPCTRAHSCLAAPHIVRGRAWVRPVLSAEEGSPGGQADCRRPGVETRKGKPADRPCAAGILRAHKSIVCEQRDVERGICVVRISR